MAFLSREGWVKTCFVVSLWVNHACIFALSSASFTSWHAQAGSAGRCLCDAAVTSRRGSVALTGRRGTAKLQPGIRLQRTRRTIVPGPARSVGFWIGFAWYHVTTFLPTNAAGRDVAHSYVSAMVSLMTHIYFKWIIYISHNFVWIHDVVKHNSRCASFCYDLKSWNTFWYSALLYLL